MSLPEPKAEARITEKQRQIDELRLQCAELEDDIKAISIIKSGFEESLRREKTRFEALTHRYNELAARVRPEINVE